ncbi:hypothetical protein O5O51_08525 [Sinirhodobacter sp. HNIBRBA609]|nr:hypothetical protein O5O51_08525 [Sinirhodobacter sp. HNIBRBA609]
MRRLRRLWHEQRLVVIVFALAVGLTLFFGGRMVARAIYWADPEHRQQHPEAWMTPRYIARSWHLQVDQVDAVIGISNGPELVGSGPPTLERIAEVLNVPVAELIKKLDTALPQLATPDR